MGGRAPLSPKERELHAQLLAEGKLMSGKCGGHDYYVVNGKQRWRRHAVPKDPCTLAWISTLTNSPNAGDGIPWCFFCPAPPLRSWLPL